MGQMLPEIPDYLMEWIPKQQMFWVASAPLSPDGHINISPKGVEGTFHVVNSRRVWYEDLSGTGAETVAHIRENGRVTILFNAFEGPARIVRLYGKGIIYELGTPEYDALLPADKRQPGSRAVIALDVFKVAATCGYAVPFYQFIGHRTQLNDWAERREAEDKRSGTSLTATHTSSPSCAYAPPPPSSSLIAPEDSTTMNPKGMKFWWMTHNVTSLDGLPAFTFARRLLLGTFTPTSRRDEGAKTGNKKSSRVSVSNASIPPMTTPSPLIHSRQQQQWQQPLPKGSDEDIVLRPFKAGIRALFGLGEGDEHLPYSALPCFIKAVHSFINTDNFDLNSEMAYTLRHAVYKSLPVIVAFFLGLMISRISQPITISRSFNVERACYQH